MILAARTDSWDVEVYLIDTDGSIIDSKTWNAGRNLSKELLSEMKSLAETSNGDIRSKGFFDGLIVYKGPGSFTGLRIGVSVLNAIAFSLRIPIVGINGRAWLQEGAKRLRSGGDDEIVIPNYGRTPNITKPKK